MTALTFPRPMPDFGPAQQVFEPQDVNLESAETGGALYGLALGEKRWSAEWTLGQALNLTRSDAWRAFLRSLNGSARSFLGRDVSRPYPLNYLTGFAGLTRAGGGSFDGSLTSWSQTISAAPDSLALATFHGLPAGFAMLAGDYVDFRWTTLGVARRHMVALLEDAAADGSGVITGVAVDPPIHSRVVPGGAVAHLDNPCCVMRVMTSQTKLSPMNRRRVIGGTIVAVQDLRP